jgi:hypothetical protein
MNKFRAIMAAMAHCWLFSACYGGAIVTGAPHSSSFLNRDGTTLSTAFLRRPQAYQVFLTKAGETRLIQTLSLEFENKDMHSATTSDLNGDGYGDVVLEGDCGNRTCAGSVYFFNSGNGNLHKVFTKEFSTITQRDDLLILGSGSGCCSFEYQALRFSVDRMSVDLKPVLYIGIKAPGAQSEKSKCFFLDSNFAYMPANRALIDLCTLYGQSFEIESSDSRQ